MDSGSIPGAGGTQGPWPPLALVALLLALSQVWTFSGRPACIDYYQFWVVGQAVREEGTGDVYSQAERTRLGQLYAQRAMDEARELPQGSEMPLRLAVALQRQLLETYSTPWLYTLLGSLSSGSYRRDQAFFQALSLLAYAAALIALVRLLEVPVASAVLCMLIFLAWFAPHASDIRVGNVNRLQLAFLALALWLLARRWRGSTALAGAVLGQAVMFKPNLAFSVLLLAGGWALLGRWRSLASLCAGGAAGAVAAFLLSSVYFGGAGAWLSWAREVPALMREYDHAVAKGNYALPKLIELATGRSSSALLLVGLTGAAFAAVAVLRRAQRRGLELAPFKLDVLLVGLGAAIAVLGADLAWIHYFLFLIPLALWSLRGAGGAAVGAPWTRAAALVAILLLALDGRGVPGLTTGTTAAAVLASGAALLLFASAVAEAWQHERVVTALGQGA